MNGLKIKIKNNDIEEIKILVIKNIVIFSILLASKIISISLRS